MFSNRLHEAVRDGEADRVQLMLGQRVQVVAPATDEVVVEGNVESIDLDRKVVVVRSVNGTDLSVHVDSDRYEIWVHREEITGKAPEPQPKHRSVRASRPGPHTGGRF